MSHYKDMMKISTSLLSLAMCLLPMGLLAQNVVDEDSVIDGRLAVLPTPKMVFDKDVLDFGRLSSSKGEKRTMTFTFTNKGNAPLIIERVETNCGCTKVKYSHKAVEPGKKGTVKVTVDASLQEDLGTIGSLVTIYFSAPQSFTRIRAIGTFVE